MMDDPDNDSDNVVRGVFDDDGDQYVDDDPTMDIMQMRRAAALAFAVDMVKDHDAPSSAARTAQAIEAATAFEAYLSGFDQRRSA